MASNGHNHDENDGGNDAGGDSGEHLCSESMGYPEVRLAAGKRESSIVVAWIMQIMYSELLGVPSTIEPGSAGKSLNFNDESNRLEYGTADEYDRMFQHAQDAEGDCTAYIDHNKGASGEDYIPCAHAIMDIWSRSSSYYEDEESDVSESKMFLGAVGFNGWYGKYEQR